MVKSILPWVASLPIPGDEIDGGSRRFRSVRSGAQEQTTRALFSLIASCYIVAALVFPGFWLYDDVHLPLAAWWPAYFALELVLVGAPVSYAVWQLVWAPAAALQAARPAHLARLMSGVLLVVYGFLVIPAACFISLPHRANLYAGFIALAAAAFATMGYLAYIRRASRR